MATTPRKPGPKPAAAGGAYLGTLTGSHRYCAARYAKPPGLPAGLAPQRARLLRETANKWLNGSVIHYWFFDRPATWAGATAQKNVVRKAFAQWKALGLGLSFVEVKQRGQADVRIAFLQGDGSWSYVGTDVLTARDDPRTMNFGWSLTEDPANGIDTALHEIGHTLGFPHEHQNPFAGIVWNEEAVYAELKKPDNNWSRAKTFANILQKIEADTVQGSQWDPDSIMHYPFEAGLIRKPAKYRQGLTPAGGLSARDRAWAQAFYPPLDAADTTQLLPFQTASVSLSTGQPRTFTFNPTTTRDYEFRSFGEADVSMALYAAGKAKALASADDGGEAHNASFKLRLKAATHYELRLRLRFAQPAAQVAVMVW